MPRRRVVQKRRPIRRFKRRMNRKRGGRKKIYSKKTGFPDKYFVTLKFGQNVQFQATGISSDTNYVHALFSGNDPSNPFIGVGDNLPLEYSRFRTIYRFCKVVASGIKINFLNYNAAAFQAIIYPSHDITKIPPDASSTQRYSRNSKFTGVPSQGAGPLTCVLSNSMWTSKIYGIPNLKYDSSHLFSVDNTPGESNIFRNIAPPNLWYWHLLLHRPHSSITGQINCVGRVELWYKCVFYGKHQVTIDIAENTDEDEELQQDDEADITVEVTDPPAPIV